MRKRDELARGCMAKAGDDEMTFVLLGRDAAAPATIRFWIAERIKSGKNEPGDAKLVEAEECARAMEAERAPSASPARGQPVATKADPFGLADFPEGDAAPPCPKCGRHLLHGLPIGMLGWLCSGCGERVGGGGQGDMSAPARGREGAR